MAPNNKTWHALPASAAAEAFGTDPDRGLTTEAVQKLRDLHGLNALPPAPRPSVVRQILAQFLNPLVGTLLLAAAIAVGVAVWGDQGAHPRGLARFSDAIAILTIVIVNAFIGFYQERKAEKALDALMKLSAARCRVRRNGEINHADARQLVPGDLVLLEAGDKVPADLRLLHASDLLTIEGELTGESSSVEKDATAVVAEDASVGDRTNMVFSGTTVVNGEARGVVVATGRETEVGKVGKLLADVEQQQSPLEERLDDFGQKILYGCFGLSLLLFGIGIIRGGAWHELLLTAVSLAVAVIPEGLPAITSITLALGMQRMAQRGAVVRKLAAVETLGCATVVCTDKTGTLTLNEMTVRTICAGGHRVEVTGEGYGDRGELKENGARLVDPSEPLRRTIAIGAIANTASVLSRHKGETQVSGDPTEAALIALASKIQVVRHSALGQSEELFTIPFNSNRKRMTVVTRERRAQSVKYTAYTKGAIDVLLPLCTQIRTDAGVVDLTDAMRKDIQGQAEALAADALRVLAMAEREGGEELTARDEVERSMTFVGMVGMIDPPRPEVKAAIRECALAGIRVVMITGDHPITAQAIARELGLWGEGSLALTGEELRKMDDEALAAVLPRVKVFARVDPEHKLRIVKAFQDLRGEVVAMTGDGVNDAPAIKQAAIGVAMGKGGTDVAREAADMVLQDDNFTTIVEAVREGRAIYRNIQKSIFFLLSSNAGLCIAVFLTGFFSPTQCPPLTALQILWINLVTNGLPALALGVDPPENGQMREPPRPPNSPVLSSRDWVGILLVGVLMAASAMVIYWLPIWQPGDTPQEIARSKLTMVFTLLALSPLAHAFNCRSERASMFSLGFLSNPFLIAAVIVSAAIHGISLVVPALQPVFKTNHDWSWMEFGIVVGLSLLPVPVVEIVKVVMRQRFQSRALVAAP